jgi:hypothetical protein
MPDGVHRSAFTVRRSAGTVTVETLLIIQRVILSLNLTFSFRVFRWEHHSNAAERRTPNVGDGERFRLPLGG